MDAAQQLFGLGFSLPKRGKLRIEWTIDDFSQIDTAAGKRIESPITKADIDGVSTSWCVLLFPNGRKGEEGYLEIYLAQKNAVSDSLLVKAASTFTVGQKVSGPRQANEYNAKYPAWGQDKFITRKKLIEDAAMSLPNDKLKIVVDADIAVTAKLNNIRYSEMPDFSDLTVRCVESLKDNPRKELATLHAHRLVVSHFSGIFKRQLVTEDTIDLETPPAVVRCFLRLAYNEKLNLQELSDNAIRLLSFAGRYEIGLLFHLTESYLIDRSTAGDADEVSRLLRAADDASADRLKSACVAYFRDNREAMRTSKEFKPRDLSDALLKELFGEVGAGPDSGVSQLLESSTGAAIADCTVRCVEASRTKRQRTTGASASNGRSTASKVLREFKSHRLVLCSRSAVFRAMFANPNSTEAKTGIINVPDVTPDVMSVLLNLFNNGAVNDADLDKHAEGLFYALDKYQCDDLKTRIEMRLRRRLSVDNCVILHALADRHHVDSFKRACLTFIYDNWQAVRSTIDTNAFNPELLMEIMNALRPA